MAESKRTPRAVLWSALLHLGLAAFLFLTTLSCTTWEHVFDVLHLPEGWNPVTCTKPLSLKGPVIDATLVGESGAPLPPPVKTPEEKASVPPPKPSKPVVEQEKPEPKPVKTLPAPPKQPDVKDQQKVVAEAQQKAEKAKREQQEKEKQRMSELEAEKQREQQKKLDEIFKQLDQARQSREHASKQSKLEEQKLAQLKDLEKKSDSKAPPRDADVKQADKAQSGNNGTDDDAYKAAVQNAVTQSWLRPDNIPEGTVCPIHIVQIPGGQVVSVSIGANCPFDAAAKRSVKNAVLRAQPLPYKGYEKAFRTDITLNFTVED